MAGRRDSAPGVLLNKKSCQTEAMTITRRVLKRRGIIYAVLCLLIPVLGLATRTNAGHLPALWADYAPDTLWALLVFSVGATLAPRLPTWKLALFALGFAYLMECSQLYQAPWINHLRATRIGGLLLGFGFLWSDLLCYTIGIGLGALLDFVILSKSPASGQSTEGHRL